MRNKLKKYLKERHCFTAHVERYGQYRGYSGGTVNTILLTNIKFKKSDEVLTDHLWFKCGKWSLSLHSGDDIEFECRVNSYNKGYVEKGWDVFLSREQDYRLERPTKVKVISA